MISKEGLLSCLWSFKETCLCVLKEPVSCSPWTPEESWKMYLSNIETPQTPSKTTNWNPQKTHLWECEFFPKGCQMRNLRSKTKSPELELWKKFFSHHGNLSVGESVVFNMPPSVMNASKDKTVTGSRRTRIKRRYKCQTHLLLHFHFKFIHETLS